MEYRILNPEDYPQYNSLRSFSIQQVPDAFGGSESEEIKVRKEKFDAMMGHPTNFIMGAFHGTEMVGMVGFLKQDSLKKKHKGYIFGMYVLDNRQGKGVGKQLLQVALDRAQKIEGLKQIHLGVGAHNEKARGLYLKLGFVEYGREPNSIQIDGIFYTESLMVKMV